MKAILESIVVEGEGIEEAINKALQQLNSSKDDVEIEILQVPIRRLFGILSQKAKVRVSLKEELKKTVLLHNMVSQLFEFLDIKASFQISSRNGDFMVAVDPKGAPGLIIGKYGRTLDAIEHLLWKASKSKFKHQGRVMIDVGGYRDRQNENLKRSILEAAKRVSSNGERMVLEPLTLEEAKTALAIINRFQDIEWRTTGKGFYKNIELLPRGALPNKARISEEVSSLSGQ